MLVERYRDMLGKKSVIRELSEFATARGREIGYENVFDYSLGNPSVPVPQRFTEEMIRLIQEDDGSLHGYSPSLTLPEVRQAVAESLKKRFGLPYEADHIFMTSGAAGAMVYELNGTPVAFPENGSLDGTRALLLAGNFGYMRYAIRQDVTYKILDQATITDNEGRVILNLAQQDCVALRAVMRLGWALPRPVNMVSGLDYFPFAVLTPASH